MLSPHPSGGGGSLDFSGDGEYNAVRFASISSLYVGTVTDRNSGGGGRCFGVYMCACILLLRPCLRPGLDFPGEQVSCRVPVQTGGQRGPGVSNPPNPPPWEARLETPRHQQWHPFVGQPVPYLYSKLPFMMGARGQVMSGIFPSSVGPSASGGVVVGSVPSFGFGVGSTRCPGTPVVSCPYLPAGYRLESLGDVPDAGAAPSRGCCLGR